MVKTTTTNKKLEKFLTFKKVKNSTLSHVRTSQGILWSTNLDNYCLVYGLDAIPDDSMTEPSYSFNGINRWEKNDLGLPLFDEVQLGRLLGSIGNEWNKGIKKAIGYMAPEDTRFVFNGVFFGRHLVATDGRRLYKSKGEFRTNFNKIVSHETLKKIMMIESDLTISFYADYVQANGKIGENLVTVYGKYIQGEFPDYERVIPSHFEYETFLGGAGFREFLKLACKMAVKPSRQVRLDRSIAKFCLDEQDEKLETSWEPFNLSQPVQVSLGFKGDYLLGLESFTIKYNDSNSPVMVESDDFVEVIMPMKL